MVDIKIHQNHNDQLLSMKGVDYNYSGKLHLVKLLTILSTRCQHILVHVRINNYQNEYIEELRSKVVCLDVQDLSIDCDLFEISFNLSSKAMSDGLLWVLNDLWFSFEQPAYFFFSKKEDFDSSCERFLRSNLTWKEITETSAVYLMFKGVEEDVVWVGKSENLEFNIV